MFETAPWLSYMFSNINHKFFFWIFSCSWLKFQLPMLQSPVFPTPNTWYLILNTWYHILYFWYFTSETWILIFDLSYLRSDTSYLIPDTWYLTLSPTAEIRIAPKRICTLIWNFWLWRGVLKKIKFLKIDCRA